MAFSSKKTQSGNFRDAGPRLGLALFQSDFDVDFVRSRVYISPPRQFEFLDFCIGQIAGVDYDTMQSRGFQDEK